MVNENKFSSLKTIYLEGKSPWGFRIIDLNESNRLRLSSPLLAVSKVRNRSKAHFAGLKEDDIILYVNDVPTSNLTLEAASDLIENSDNLCLVISTRFNDGLDDEQRLDERNSYEMSRDSQSSSEGLLSVSGGRSNVNNNDKILSANPAFSKFLTTANSINDSNASNDLTGHSSSINTTNNPTNNYYNSSSISSTTSSNPNSVKNNYNGSANIQLINSYLNSPHHHRTLNNNNNNNHTTTTTREADSIYSNQIQDSKSTNDLKHIDNYLYNSAAIANSNTYTEQLNYDNDEDYLATRRADKSANHRLRNSHNHHHNNHHHHQQQQQHYPHHYHHHHHHLPSKINLIRNYYSANESNGEDELDSYYTNKYNYNRNRSHSNSNSNSNSNYNNKYRSSSISNRNNTNANANAITNNNRSDSRLRDNKNNNNNNNNSRSNNGVLQAPSKVSYASITLRQPLKDVNYFSDTEAINAPRFRVKNLSYSSYHRNHHNYNNNHNTNNNLSNSTNCNGSNTMNRVLLTSNSFNHNHNSNNDYNNNPNIINNNHRRSNSQNYNHSILSNNNNNFYDNHKLSESDYITKTNFPSYDYFNNRNTNNNNNLEDFLFASKYLNEEMNQNTINSINNNKNNNQNQNNMFSLSTATDFNRKPHGFSKLSPLNGRPGGASSISPTNIQYAPQSQPQQFMYQQPQQHQQQQQSSNQRPFVANQSPRLFPGSNVNAAPANYNQTNVWTPSSQIQIASATQEEEDVEDPIIEKYEREMGSELAPMSTKPHYSDSYFYNSPVFNYPTIDDQKKLAKTIADTLEGSNPATSKYHKKKQNLLRQQAARDGGYESEPLQSPGYEQQQQHQHHSSGGDKEPLSPPPAPPLPSLFDDSSLPDVIKRSIAQANRIDPVCMVQAPENFRQQHYTEHVSHTEMPPKAAMSLAAALENAEPNKGGRGAQIFQRRKAKSEKWVVDESNVKKPPGQQYNFQPPPMQKPQPVYQPPPTPQPVQRLEPKVAVESDQYSNKYSDFNAKPRGWSHGQNPPSNAGYESPRLDEMVRPRLQPDQFISKVEFIESPASSAANKTSNLVYNPNKLDLSAWNQQRLAEQQQAASQQPANISKDGIQNLKAKFYESIVKSSEPTSLLAFNPHQSSIMIGAPPSSSPPTISKVKLNKLSSHENYLFNNKNSQNALRNTTNQLYNNNNINPTQSSFFNYDENIAASDL